MVKQREPPRSFNMVRATPGAATNPSATPSAVPSLATFTFSATPSPDIHSKSEDNRDLLEGHARLESSRALPTAARDEYAAKYLSKPHFQAESVSSSPTVPSLSEFTFSATTGSPQSVETKDSRQQLIALDSSQLAALSTVARDEYIAKYLSKPHHKAESVSSSPAVPSLPMFTFSATGSSPPQPKLEDNLQVLASHTDHHSRTLTSKASDERTIRHPSKPHHHHQAGIATLSGSGKVRHAQLPIPSNQIPSVLPHQVQQPEFGKASPLRNPLKNTSASIFNIPKPHQARAEHHRTTVPGGGGVKNTSGLPTFRPPPIQNKPFISADAVFIPKPTNVLPATIPAAPIGTFTTTNYPPANPFKAPRSVVDLTSPSQDTFDPDRVDLGRNYNSFDPHNYVDATQASQNIKALLEGAFEDDEDDKPRPRPRPRKPKDVDMTKLANKLKALEVDRKIAGEEDAEEEDDGSVEGLSVKLLPHQIDGLAWMLDKEIGERKKNGVLPKGGILADDMGLGKTIQSLSLIMSNPRPLSGSEAAKKLKIPDAAGKGTLVVAPLALIKQWESEIKTKVLDSHSLKVLVHHGPSRAKRAEDLKKYDVVITTYQTLTSEHEGSSDTATGLKVGCFGVQWFRVILDEAHSIKNRNAKMTKAAYALSAVFRWCLTGTPMQNNLDELQSLIRFLQIKPYNDLSSWKAQIGQPMKDGRGGLAIKRLQYFLKALMKRRTKDVLKKGGALTFGKGSTATDGETKSGGFKIVGRKVETIVVKFNDSEREFYDRLVARTERSLETMMGGAKTDYIGALVLLLRLRQTCNHQELIKGGIAKEKDSIQPVLHEETRRVINMKESTKAGEDVEDVADLFGAMSVANKKCDVCQAAMSKTEMKMGALRCRECEVDLASAGFRKKNTSKSSGVLLNGNEPRRRVQKKHVIDSDEEEDAEWVVPHSQRHTPDLGRAGGIDDEDAEGTGESIGEEDSDTGDDHDNDDDDDDDNDIVRRPRRLVRRHKDHHTESDRSDDTESGSNDAGPKNKKSMRHVASTKIRRLLQILEAESEKHKFIVFSEFTSMLDLVEPFLRDRGFRFTRYDGSMKNDEREASLGRLRNDSKVRILLCSLRCGSLGLNLTAASRVVIMEPFWNPFVEEQAIDRVHRLNQTQDVQVYRLTVADTVEERILALQEKKRELSKAAIDGAKAGAKLSMQDILQLFKPNAEHRGDSHVERIMSNSAGLLTSPAKTSRGPSQHGTTREREKAKFKIPPSVQPQYDAAFGRRW